MANYDNQYSLSITPANPNLRGISDNFSNDGQTNLQGYGLGDVYELDYDRNKIEGIFNQGTDAKYALMQKENRIAENQYANNQFANQQSAIETLRQQRNKQIASGMARGLNAAEEQGTILGVQQTGASGALELANNRQLEADKIASEYANNVSKALQEANSVKEAMASVAAQLYEADMLGYTGELNAAAQMDANATNRYGYDKGYEGTVYTADKGLEGTKYNADQNLIGTKYAADQNLEGTKYNADRNYDGTVYSANKNYEGTKYAADKNLEGTKYAANKSYSAQVQAANISASAQKAAAAIAAAGNKNTNDTMMSIEYAFQNAVKRNPNLKGNELISTITSSLASDPNFKDMNQDVLWKNIDQYVVGAHKNYKDKTYEQWANGK